MSRRLLRTPRGKALAVCLALFVAAPAAAYGATIVMSGSTSVYPLAIQLATRYNHQYHVKFRIGAGGSDIGVADAQHGRVQIGDVSRDRLPSDRGLAFSKIARDGICVITNRANPVGNLSQGQVQAIFSGRVRTWSRVKGARVRGPIRIITRTAASGTADAFQNIFMGFNYRVAPSATPEASNGLVNQAVRSSPANAIGFVSEGGGYTTGVHTVPYRGVGCTLRNSKSGQYGGVRNFWFVTRGKPAGTAAKFIRWVRTSSAARRIISTHWIPLR